MPIKLKPIRLPKLNIKINTGFIFIGESTIGNTEEYKPDEVRCFLIKPLKRKRGKR